MKKAKTIISFVWRRKLLVVGPLLLAYIVVSSDLHSLLTVLVGISLGQFVIAVALSVAEVLCRAARWRALLAPSADVRWWDAALMYYAGFFWGGLTPGRVGELYKIQYLRERGVGAPAALASVVGDRLLDLITLGGVTVVGIILVPAYRLPTSIDSRIGLFFWAAPVIGIIALCFLLSSNNDRRKKSIEILKLIRDSIYCFRALPHRSWLMALVFTLLSFFIFLLVRWILANAVGIEAPALVIVWAVAAAAIISALPLSVQGIGTRDAVLIVVLGLSGIEKEPALVFSTLILLLIFANIGIGQIAALFVHKPSFNKLEKNSKTMKEGDQGA